jgi:N-acetylglucosaminyldiphosphoundecaprenol N-acetyl-beta-D-mannosaminyltransferase
MLRYAHELAPALVAGVGAAFDFHAGTKRRAPVWMQRAGLEWLHRLLSEPRRLASRYARTNSEFLLLAGRELLRRRQLRS